MIGRVTATAYHQLLFDYTDNKYMFKITFLNQLNEKLYKKSKLTIVGIKKSSRHRVFLYPSLLFCPQLVQDGGGQLATHISLMFTPNTPLFYL